MISEPTLLGSAPLISPYHRIEPYPYLRLWLIWVVNRYHYKEQGNFTFRNTPYKLEFLSD